MYISLFSGAFSPLTLEGQIMADDVLSSCYAHFSDHDLIQFAMTPLRWFPGITQWIFGEDNEAPVYVQISAEFGNLFLPSTMDAI